MDSVPEGTKRRAQKYASEAVKFHPSIEREKNQAKNC